MCIRPSVPNKIIISENNQIIVWLARYVQYPPLWCTPLLVVQLLSVHKLKIRAKYILEKILTLELAIVNKCTLCQSDMPIWHTVHPYSRVSVSI